MCVCLTYHTDEEEGPIARLCYMLGTEPLTGLAASELHVRGSMLVFLNGQLLGVHRCVVDSHCSTAHTPTHTRARAPVGTVCVSMPVEPADDEWQCVYVCVFVCVCVCLAGVRCG